jgi:DNA-binding CsgD family transcriptional regulator
MTREHVLTPDDLYRAARFEDCLRETEGVANDDARIARARTYLHTNRQPEALAEAECIAATTGDLAATAGAIRCRALSAAREWRKVDAWLATAFSSYGELSAVGRAEITMAAAVTAMHRGRPDDMEVAAADIDVDAAGPRYRAWKHHILGWAAAERSDYAQAAQCFERAAESMFATPEATDVVLLARVAVALAGISREMFSTQRFEFVVNLVTRIPWTSGTKDLEFMAKRSIAWGYALHGSERVANRMIFELGDAVQSANLRPWVLADQAYFARATGCEDLAAPLLERAIAVARETSWESGGEERIALLNIVLLAADRQHEATRLLLDLYDGITTQVKTNVVLAHDRRLGAMEDHARGVAFAAAENFREASSLLERAYATFAEIGFSWRAASVCLSLHAATGDKAWLQRAECEVAEYPESAIAREIRRRARGAGDPRMPSLSPTQRRVFALICQGKSNKEIASELAISVNTARNHVAAVIGRFGAHSRAHLAAVARDSGLTS